MKPQHSSQNELKPLTHNHQSQMLSATDSKTHYQSKFSSSDQTSTASYDNIDTIRARPMCGAHVWCGCNLETVLARFQKNLHQPPLCMVFQCGSPESSASKRSQNLYSVYSTEPSLILLQG